MKKSWTILIALLLILAVTSYGAARLLRPTWTESPRSEPLFAMLHDYLGLTPDQRSRVSEIDAKYAARRSQIRQQLWDARDHLLDVVRDPNASRNDAIAAIRRFGSARQEMAESTMEYVFDLREILTPAQKAKLASVMGRGVCALTGGPGMGGCGRPRMAPDSRAFPGGPRWGR